VLEPRRVVARGEVAPGVSAARFLACQRAGHGDLGEVDQVLELQRMEQVRVVDVGLVGDRCLTGPGGTVVVGGRAGPPGRWEAESGTVDARRSQGPIGRLAGWRGRRRARAESDRWAREIERRVRAVAASGPRKVLVLSHMGLRQAVSGRPDALPVDPNLGVVVDRLRSMDRLAAIVGLGLDQRAAADRATLETDPLLLPASLLYTRWRDPGVEPEPALTGLAEWPESDRGRPLEVEGIDLGRALSEAIRSAASSEIPGALRQSSRIQRAISELRPGAILMTHEGIRTTWLVAAQRAGIPTFAVQHGILYPRHPGYSGERQAGRVLPTRTFVYGPFERDTLVEYCGYLPEEVIVSGSPRLDLDRAAVGHGDADDPVREADREAVRRDLGVAQPDRMLVVSTTFLPIVRDFHLVSMLARVIGGPLPGVHVVFKQHPGERDEGPYRRLLVGLARAGGYDPPSVTVVRDIDLYRVLRAADAHLGLQSTVLTDAVVVGVPNLIAVGQAAPDLLGYAAAGVARPVRDVADVRAALASPVVADARTRRAFLERHFRPGDAGDRITAELVGWLA